MRYLNRLPFRAILDRFDLSIEVPLLPQGSLQNTGDRGETSQQSTRKSVKSEGRFNLLEPVKSMHIFQAKKLNGIVNYKIKMHYSLRMHLNKLGLSVRAYHRILKVSRTIADLNGEKEIQQPHLAEALGYRRWIG